MPRTIGSVISAVGSSGIVIVHAPHLLFDADHGGKKATMKAELGQLVPRARNIELDETS